MWPMWPTCWKSVLCMLGCQIDYVTKPQFKPALCASCHLGVGGGGVCPLSSTQVGVKWLCSPASASQVSEWRTAVKLYVWSESFHSWLLFHLKKSKKFNFFFSFSEYKENICILVMVQSHTLNHFPCYVILWRQPYCSSVMILHVFDACACLASFYVHIHTIRKMKTYRLFS